MVGACSLVCTLATAQQGAPPGMVQAPASSPRLAQPAPSAAEAALQGVWAWELTAPGGALSRFLIQRRPDGNFTLISRTYAAGRATAELVNGGLWGVSNGLYFTVTTEVNGQRVDTRDSALYNPYVILALEGDVLRYRHLPTGLELRTLKVRPDTRLPD